MEEGEDSCSMQPPRRMYQARSLTRAAAARVGPRATSEPIAQCTQPRFYRMATSAVPRQRDHVFQEIPEKEQALADKSRNTRMEPCGRCKTQTVLRVALPCGRMVCLCIPCSKNFAKFLTDRICQVARTLDTPYTPYNPPRAQHSGMPSVPMSLLSAGRSASTGNLRLDSYRGSCTWKDTPSLRLRHWDQKGEKDDVVLSSKSSPWQTDSNAHTSSSWSPRQAALSAVGASRSSICTDSTKPAGTRTAGSFNIARSTQRRSLPEIQKPMTASSFLGSSAYSQQAYSQQAQTLSAMQFSRIPALSDGLRPGLRDQRSQNMSCNFRKVQVDKLRENIIKTFQEVARNSAFTGLFLRRPTEFQMT